MKKSVARAAEAHERGVRSWASTSFAPGTIGVDPEGPRAPRPFQRWTTDGRLRPHLRKVHPDFAKMFDLHPVEGANLDLESRKGKAPGGYQTVFEWSACPSSSRTPRACTATSRRCSTRAALVPFVQCGISIRRFNRDYPTEFAEVA